MKRILLAFVLSSHVFASLSPEDALKHEKLQQLFKQKPANNKQVEALRDQVFLMGNKAVPVLINVMKDDKMPDKNRWMATFLLGRIMGDKAAPFIAKFAEHPNYLMRMASLKTLLHLNQKNYVAVYSKALRDKSLLVRYQALDNVQKMKIKSLSPQVWAMLYDQNNYAGNDGKRKRTAIVKKIIQTVGSLRHQKVEKQLLTLMKKNKYNDLAPELDQSLQQITGKNSPVGAIEAKRQFWDKYSKENI